MEERCEFFVDIYVGALVIFFILSTLTELHSDDIMFCVYNLGPKFEVGSKTHNVFEKEEEVENRCNESICSYFNKCPTLRHSRQIIQFGVTNLKFKNIVT